MSESLDERIDSGRIALSIVLPLRNLDRSPLLHVETIVCDLHNLGLGRWELVLVTDPMTRQTELALHAFARAQRGVVLIRNPGSRGVGYSARHGILLSQGKTVVLAVGEPRGAWLNLPSMLSRIEEGIDLVVGSDRLPGSRSLPSVRIRRELLRRVVGRPPLGLLNGHAGGQFGAFHLYDRNAATQIYQRQRVENEGFAIEVLYLAQRYGFSVLESGLAKNVESDRDFGALPMPPPNLAELLHIRYRRLRGDYG